MRSLKSNALSKIVGGKNLQEVFDICTQNQAMEDACFDNLETVRQLLVTAFGEWHGTALFYSRLDLLSTSEWKDHLKALAGGFAFKVRFDQSVDQMVPFYQSKAAEGFEEDFYYDGLMVQPGTRALRVKFDFEVNKLGEDWNYLKSVMIMGVSEDSGSQVATAIVNFLATMAIETQGIRFDKIVNYRNNGDIIFYDYEANEDANVLHEGLTALISHITPSTVEAMGGEPSNDQLFIGSVAITTFDKRLDEYITVAVSIMGSPLIM